VRGYREDRSTARTPVKQEARRERGQDGRDEAGFEM